MGLIIALCILLLIPVVGWLVLKHNRVDARQLEELNMAIREFDKEIDKFTEQVEEIMKKAKPEKEKKGDTIL